MRKILVGIILFFLFSAFSYAEIYENIENELKNENYEEAIYMCQKLIKSGKKDPQLLLLKAKAEWNAGFIKDCIETLKQVLTSEPKNEEALYLLAQCYISLEKFDEAKKLIKKLPTENDKRFFLEGLLYYKEGKYDLAKIALEKIATKNFQDKASIYLAQIAIIYNERPKAFNILKDIPKDSPYYSKANFLLDSLKENSLKFKLSLGEAYDTNVTVAPEGELISKEDSLRTFSDTQFTYWANTWNFSSDIYCGFNHEVTSYNTINFSTKFEKFWNTLSFPINFSYTWLDQNFYNDKFSLGISETVDFLKFSIEVGYQNYMEPLTSEEDRDGVFSSLSISYKRFIRHSFIFLPNCYVSYYNTSGSNWKHASTGIDILTAYKHKSFSLSVTGNLMWNYFIEENSFYDEKRNDLFLRIASIISLWIKNNMKLNFSCSYMKNFSNISFYEYNRSIFTISTDYVF